jgi:molybdate transport system substrate-binding protein
MSSLVRFFVGFASLVLVFTTDVQAQETVTVFAAASLKEALDNAARHFTKDTGVKVHTSYAASSALARQIDQGAPADLFASADLDWMDYLAQRNLIQTNTRVNLLGNKLVLIAPKDSPLSDMNLDTPSILSALGADGRLVTGEINSVPVGKYAKAAMEKLGLWSGVSARMAMTENVRAALILVARGEAPLGIVYASDAKAEPRVKVVASFPPDSHPPVIYPFALTATGKGNAAAKLLDFLKGSAKEFFEQRGFTFLAQDERS